MEYDFLTDQLIIKNISESTPAYNFDKISCKPLKDALKQNLTPCQLMDLLLKYFPATYGHSMRVADYCKNFGDFLNFSEKDLSKFYLFAKFHDIGKAAVPPAVLQKKGKLTDSEWAEIKKHTVFGYLVANKVTGLSAVSKYILCHHEHWDGSGYPLALSGEKIPPFCRILAVIDAFDAMTHDRYYRKAMSITDSLAELNNNSGTQFEAKAVKNFISFIKSDC